MSVRVRWSIEVNDLLSICDLINNNINNKIDIAKFLGRGQEKVRCSLEWLKYMELVAEKNRGSYIVTSFYSYIKSLMSLERSEDVFALLYHRVFQNYDLFQFLIGIYGYEKINQNEYFNISAEKNRMGRQAKSYMDEKGYCIKESILTTQLRNDIKSITKMEGFGNLGLLVPGDEDDNFLFSGYIPTLNTLYNVLLYNWPKETISLSIDFFINNIKSIGHMFLLTPDQVITCLKRLEGINLIDVINTGDLSYVVKKSEDTIELILKKSTVI